MKGSCYILLYAGDTFQVTEAQRRCLPTWINTLVQGKQMRTSCCYYGGQVWQAGPADSYSSRGGGRKSYSRGDKRLWVSLVHTSPLILSPPAAVCHSRGTTSSESGIVHTHTHSLTVPNLPPSTTPGCQPISCPDNCCQRENTQSFLVLSRLRPLLQEHSSSRRHHAHAFKLSKRGGTMKKMSVERGRKVPIIPMIQCRRLIVNE